MLARLNKPSMQCCSETVTHQRWLTVFCHIATTGGFGHGLEPDKQVPDSQALDVEIAFERMATAGALAPEVLAPACDWLATIADDRGAVPILMPNSNRHPRAAHWNAAAYLPALNPTAAIAGHAHAIGVMHPSLAGHSRPVSPVIGASCVKKFKPS